MLLLVVDDLAGDVDFDVARCLQTLEHVLLILLQHFCVNFGDFGSGHKHLQVWLVNRHGRHRIVGAMLLIVRDPEGLKALNVVAVALFQFVAGDLILGLADVVLGH